MKVFVSGSTGVVGLRAVKCLLEAGHEVTGAARGEAKAEILKSAGAQAVVVDLFDRDAVTRASAGHEVLVNLTTHIPPMREAAKSSAWTENDRIRNEVSANIAAAAATNGAGRIIQESIILPYADGGDKWITEDSPRDPPAKLASVERAEQNVWAAGSTGRIDPDGGSAGGTRQDEDPHAIGPSAPRTDLAPVPVILRFGMFYAPDSSHTNEQVDLARKGLAPATGSRHGYVSPLHADDAASAVVAALNAPAGAYNVVDDDPVTRGVFAETLTRAVHRKHSTFMLGNMLRLMGDARTGGMTRSLRVSNELFKDATGWAPRYESVLAGLPPVVEEILAARGAKPA